MVYAALYPPRNIKTQQKYLFQRKVIFDLDNDVKYRIRKLTPKECWRLMGFKDEDFDKAAYEKTNIKIGDLICNAKSKVAREKLLLEDMGTYALCTIKGSQELVEILTEWMKYPKMQEIERIQNVNIAIIKSEDAAHLRCATNIIRCGDCMETLCTQIKKNDLCRTVIIELEKTGSTNTGKLLKITSEENLTQKKLFIILMVIKLITESKIFTSTLQSLNICALTANLTKLEYNTVQMQISDLKMEAISIRNSSTQLYKQAGNSIVVDVLYYIYKELYTAMPYLFDDLKVGSFFSGIGAFEKGLDRLYAEAK